MTGTSILLATTFAAAFSGSSIAAAQNAAQWEGFYAGLGIDRVSGEVTFPGPLLPDTTTVSVCGGYNFAVGPDVIVGGEPAFTPGTDFDISPFTLSRPKMPPSSARAAATPPGRCISTARSAM